MWIESITPDTALAPGVQVRSTLRAGGVSQPPYGATQGGAGGLNLASHCGDDPLSVQENRSRLRAVLPGDPHWMEQVHGTAVLEIDPVSVAACPHGVRADAAVTRERRTVLAVMTADCLPVVLADQSARAIGIAHAGWRGLAAGVLENTVSALLRHSGGQAADCVAWLGPAIGPRQFEVGADVWQAFTDREADLRAYFRPTGTEGKWWADLAGLARHRLRGLGLARVEGGQWCTVEDAERFYSYRRDRVTGRMATLVWID